MIPEPWNLIKIIVFHILTQSNAALGMIHMRIQYGIETYGTCAKETLGKVQIMQNKLLKLLLKWDRRTPTDLVHYHLSILKINDMHTAKILSFVNE